MSKMILVPKLKRLLGVKEEQLALQMAEEFELIHTERSRHNSLKIMYNGDRYDSLSESVYAYKLNILLTSAKIQNIQRQVSYALEDETGRPRMRYISDFNVVSNSGTEYIIDIKGQLLRESKYKIAYAQYAHKIKVHIVFSTGPKKFDTSFIV